MEWPFDPDGDKGSHGRRRYGHRVIADKIDEDEDFPLVVEDFVAEHGDDPIRIDYETVVPMRDVFQYVDEPEFEDFLSLHKALGRALREGGYWFYEGSEQFTRSRGT
ncbi:MAG: DUF5785 family protein [Halobacteriota archaeon]